MNRKMEVVAFMLLSKKGEGPAQNKGESLCWMCDALTKSLSPETVHLHLFASIVPPGSAQCLASAEATYTLRKTLFSKMILFIAGICINLII